MKRVPAKYLPLAGIVVGAIGGGVYWLAAQLWPSSVAVVLSLFATTMLSERLGRDSFADFHPSWTDLFALLVAYNALMALTAANLGFPMPANLTLGLVMICGQAASRGLVVSVLAAQTEISPRLSGGELGIALLLGFAPALLLGLPGLIGLAAAIILRLGLATSLNRTPAPSWVSTEAVQKFTEAGFYLGAVAAWKYI